MSGAPVVASKDKLAYFKDNVQTADDQEDFDASQYYYNRENARHQGSPGQQGPDGQGISSMMMGMQGGGDMGGVGGMPTGDPSGSFGSSFAPNSIGGPGGAFGMQQGGALGMAPPGGVSRSTSATSERAPVSMGLPQDQSGGGVSAPQTSVGGEYHPQQGNYSNSPSGDLLAMLSKGSHAHAPGQDTMGQGGGGQAPGGSMGVSSMMGVQGGAGDMSIGGVGVGGMGGMGMGAPGVLGAQGQGQGGDGGAPFDLNSEFPALMTSRLANLSMGGELDGSGRFGMQEAPSFDMAAEDFPALPGSSGAGGGGTMDATHVPSGLGGEQGQIGMGGVMGPSMGSGGGGPEELLAGARQQQQQQQGGNSAIANQVQGASAFGGAMGGSGGGLGGRLGGAMGQNRSPNGGSGSGAAAAGSSPGSDRPAASGEGSQAGTDGATPDKDKQNQYGLLGLLNVIRMTDPDLNTLALGSDLTTLGLNLNSSKCLYSTFASPWSDGPSKSEPQYQLPLCYYMQQTPPLKHAHLQKFQLETLFHIFYAMPKDLLQAYAAQELYHRDWRYHMDLKLWFRRATASDGVPAHQQQPTYFYFDINSWECRLFAGNMHGNLTAGLMSEEDVRVRVSGAK